MEQEILTLRQREVIAAIAREPLLNHLYYLTGGTALAAYYLQHRISDDLDFFAIEEADRIFLHTFTEQLKERLGASGLRYERIYDRSQFFFEFDYEEIKVEFTKYPFPQLETPLEQDGIRIDTLRDITANKLMAMLDRFDPKDFIDLYFLLQQFRLKSVRQDAEKKFNIKIGNLFLGGELMKARRIEGLPKMIKPLTVGELKQFFAEEAKKLAPEILKDH